MRGKKGQWMSCGVTSSIKSFGLPTNRGSRNGGTLKRPKWPHQIKGLKILSYYHENKGEDVLELKLL